MRLEHFPEDWRHWPGREDLSDELARILSAVQHGDSELADCVAAAKRIDISDENSWFCEWALIADDAARLAEVAVGRGCIETAERHWARAIKYCQAAALPFDHPDQRQRAAAARMRACALAYLHHRDVQGQVVTIPWRDHYPLEGYFLPAKAGKGAAPALICFGEPGQRKEAHLLKLARMANDRGLSLLVVDLFGAGADEGFEEIVGCRSLETAVGSAMDYLTMRDDVDENRIAILADEWGSSFVARGIAFDPRYAAAVCDAGLWDMHERAFLARRFAPSCAATALTIGSSRVARHIACPVLIAMQEPGWIDGDHAAKLVAQMKAEHPDIAMTLKIFSARSDGSESAALADEFIFDWIAARVGRARKLQS